MVLAAARMLVVNDSLWAALDRTVLRFTRVLTGLRRDVETERVLAETRRIEANLIAARMADLVVRSGPFAGMKYPIARSTGSTLFPKLLGCYERELAPIVESICRTPYSTVVDIGCAEGYYAVGFARRLPHAKVYAFDTDPIARDLCQQMVDQNGVTDRVVIGGRCDGPTLISLPTTGRGLILSDCEGCERELFTPDLIAHLIAYDLLIETHDFLVPDTSATLQERLAEWYEVDRVPSLDDEDRSALCDHPLIADLPASTRIRLVTERRPAAMEWLFCRRRPVSTSDVLPPPRHS